MLDLRPYSALLALSATLSVAHAQTWSDDFESYAPGSALEGQGGWDGWDGVQTTFTVVSTNHARSGTRSMNPNAGPAGSTQGSDTVQQFNSPTTGTWVLEAHVYVPATFASNLDFMLMNQYAHFGPYQWGSWITFSGPNATVTCNCGGLNANVVTIPYDRWVELREIIDLDNDTAEIWFDGQLFASYTWTGGYSGTANHVIGGIAAIDIYATGAGDGLYIDDIRLYELASTIGTAYCAPANNSTGVAGALSATGFTNVATNDVTLQVEDLPNNSFGFFLTSRTQGFVMGPGNSAGNLCLGGSIGRYVGAGQIQNSGATGSFALQINLNQMPQPAGFVSAVAGETWNFQCWYRDVLSGVPTSNFTQGLSIAFN